VTTYFDASALFKLLVREDGSTEASAIWADHPDPSTSVIGHVELRAALARARRGGRVPSDGYAELRWRLDSAWGEVARVLLTDAVVAAASRVAERHALGALDAIHLASALGLREPGEDVVLVSFDLRMREAALAEGLTVLPEAL
jgi:predicted nucleic acid-binding protein